jgi:hypothetical protein
MMPVIEDALAELFVPGSPMERDARMLLKIAIINTIERCIKIAEDRGAQAEDDSSRVAAYGIAVKISGLQVDPPPAPDEAVRETDCVPCSGCGGMRRENCKAFPIHGHVWCDCQ